MSKILISAFTPFNGRESNQSLNVLEHLPNSFEKVIVETSYTKSFSSLSKKVQEKSPDLVIMLGESHKIDEVQVERVAINFIDASISDNCGSLIRHTRINDLGPDLIESQIVDSLFEGPFRISYHAGTYVCNYLYYKILREFGSQTPCLFIHVPTLGDSKDYSEDILKIISLIKGT